MKCESCQADISPKMRAAFVNNTCPFCGGSLMHALKAEQYVNLLEVLDSTTFTNRPEVDSQIKEKVANLLVTKFVFKKLDEEALPADVIVLDEPEVAVNVIAATPTPVVPVIQTPSPASPISKPTKSTPSVPTEKVASAPSRSLQPKKKSPALQKEMTLMDSFKEVTGVKHNSEDLEMDYQDDLEDPMDGLSEDEVKRFFPTLTNNDMQNLKESVVQRGLTGKGIKRV